MRILVVQESDWIKRNPVQQHHMLERLSTQGHEVLVVDYPIRWRDEGTGLIARRKQHQRVARVIAGSNVTVIRTASLRLPGLGKLSWLVTNTVEIALALRRFKPDVVVNLGLTNSLVALRLARACGVPVVFHLIDALHTLAEPRVVRPLAARVERAVLSGATRVVAINRTLGQYAARMGAPADCIEIIGTGSDTDRFGPQVSGDATREQFGFAPQDVVMVFVGWLYRFCGLKELAGAMVREADRRPELKLLVVGNGDLLPELRRLRDRGLGDRLILAGSQPVERIPELLAAGDICLLPAHHNETMTNIVPAKVYEYLAAGKPILATPLPSLIAEFGDDSGIQYVRDAGDLLAAAHRLAEDEAARTRLGVAARAAAHAAGSWQQATDRFCASLYSVCRPELQRLAERTQLAHSDFGAAAAGGRRTGRHLETARR